VQKDAERFLNSADIRKALVDGETDLSALRSLADCPQDNDAIAPFLQDALAELEQARAVLDRVVIPPADTAADVDEPWAQATLVGL
jgi:hypothetical protein